jgi:amino acid transporter
MIEQSFISQPMTYGMGDLGQLTLSSDVTQWGVGQWAAVIVGSYLAYKLILDTKSVGGKALKHTKKARRKIAKAAVGSTSKIGTVVTVGALAAAGYVAYEAYSQSQTAATQ